MDIEVACLIFNRLLNTYGLSKKSLSRQFIGDMIRLFCSKSLFAYHTIQLKQRVAAFCLIFDVALASNSTCPPPEWREQSTIDGSQERLNLRFWLIQLKQIVICGSVICISTQ